MFVNKSVGEGLLELSLVIGHLSLGVIKFCPSP